MFTLSRPTMNQGFVPVPSFPDPNAQRNRVLSSKEMTALKHMSESNARFTRMLDEELEQLRSTYETVHNRYLQLQLDIEATQSELHRVRSLINASEVQRALRQSEQQDLLALMHPIRRCPDDILREIFELVTANIASWKDTLNESVNLSSVCQKWRLVAISTPSLWTKVSFDLNNEPEVLEHQQQTVVSRIKGRAASIVVGDLEYPPDPVEWINACGLDMFPLIENLHFNLKKPGNIIELLRPDLSLPAGRVRKLVIDAVGPSSRLRDIGQPKWIGENLLDQFPGLLSATINGVSMIQFQMTKINSTLTELTINNAKYVAIMSILWDCPELETLTLRDTLILGDPTPVEAPSLKSLQLESTEGDAWMIHTSLPKLETLIFFPDTPAILTLISTNRSIKSLVYRGATADILDIAPQLLALNITPPLHALSTTLASSQMVLPNLGTLVVDMLSISYEMTMQEFDMFVRARCLHVDHPKSLAKKPSQVISDLIFILPVNHQPQKWQASELYKESTRKEDIQVLSEKKLLYLEWPVHTD
ncbi:hypothetical protein M408DRAFT_27978 [Serendipita vermifera MAFF 305830]|uniref:Uncharacterized protein n=1 Tax=Serendipita vermifera MAFF 305830 TaxID=933852 RepID=A0A0C2X1A7_SERVB|nr:hypothetical protein M408DRAFT_27978 [Serendipita vermifera MAFF 305830]